MRAVHMDQYGVWDGLMFWTPIRKQKAPVIFGHHRDFIVYRYDILFNLNINICRAGNIDPVPLSDFQRITRSQ